MTELIFRVDGVTRERWRKRHRASHPSNFVPTIGAWLVAAVAVVYGIPALQFGVAGLLSGSRAAVVEGRLLIGMHVILIPDTSGSMSDPARRQTLQDQIARLKASGMAILEGRGLAGFGVSKAKHPDSLLFEVERALQAHQEADTIYAFSDFEVTGSHYWQSDAEGYEQLGKILSDRRVRLYIGTVKYQPPGELLKIARESGGGLIPCAASSGLNCEDRPG